jgi:hypothetical protein
MVTIKHDNMIYHGIILEWLSENVFIFGFRIGGQNYEWKCDRDYWEVYL